MNLIEFNHVYKNYLSEKSETKVLNDITFKIKENEIISLLGPSGCGKSTILNLVSELISPSQGKIIKNAKIGYMFQKDCLLPWRNIYENLLIGLEIKKDKSKKSLDNLNELMKKYHIEDFKKYYPNELSGGLRQRVSLIRTLVLNPNLLLLDEPFSKLDFQTRLIVQDDVFKIIKSEKVSALMVTHDIEEAISLSDRIIILSNRPTTIKKEIALNFDSSLSIIERRKSPLFNQYFNQIYEILNNE